MKPARPARIGRIYETILYGEDLEAMTRFYRDVLGLTAAEPLGDSGRRFGVGETVLLIFDPNRSSAPGREVPSHGCTGSGHIALSIEASEFDEWLERLKQADVAIEQIKVWPKGVRSVYFRDPAGNSVELIDGEWPLW